MKLTQVGALITTLATFVRGYSFSDFSKTSDQPASSSKLKVSTGLTTDDEARIIGGMETTIDAFPYMASLRPEHPDSNAFCGGALIAPQSLHPSFSWETSEYDIGLLKLERPVSQQPARLCGGDGSDNEVGTTATVVGWGATEDKNSSYLLNSVDVEIISNEKCNKSFDGAIFDTMLCAGTDNGKGVCSGDSGSPLIVDGVIVGIVSMGGTPCGKTPGVYMRVASMLDYIDNVLTYGINDTNSQFSAWDSLSSASLDAIIDSLGSSFFEELESQSTPV
ncbi:hypothetical protein PHYBOEH_009732 [Phytophthora boehmeriae]|uniref:Peptidase S1 domain-containing protein n=1 Tax=Phytophthora boehmeriae TaxID=109152 RepID=A0A8T1VRC5_9STRA|nr:hypothetical protein PHYBOEH_009732 [Phytophthora boehmeriae]